MLALRTATGLTAMVAARVVPVFPTLALLPGCGLCHVQFCPSTCPPPSPEEHRAGGSWGTLSTVKCLKHLCEVQQTSLHAKLQVSREQIQSETSLLVTDINFLINGVFGSAVQSLALFLAPHLQDT